jgi:iron(II)-dependent oxidoreductase
MPRGLFIVALAAVLLAIVACSVCPAQDVKPWEKPGTKVGDEIIGPDGGKMVWVPAGEFMLGTNEAIDKDEDYSDFTTFFSYYPAAPAHRVRITKGFWLGKCTVTVAQYRRYCQKTGVEFPNGSDQREDHPVVVVSWIEADAYCSHFGLTLPSEAQWEYAARGPESRKYPWGNEWDSKKCCNWTNRGPGGRTFPVGSFPQGASWCGALDMAGNVSQWCRDWWSDKYYAHSPQADPQGPDTGQFRVLRGTFWMADASRFYQCAERLNSEPTERGSLFGFRYSKTP